MTSPQQHPGMMSPQQHTGRMSNMMTQQQPGHMSYTSPQHNYGYFTNMISPYQADEYDQSLEISYMNLYVSTICTFSGKDEENCV